MNWKQSKWRRIYGPMYMDLDDYSPYSEALPTFFETKINSNITCIHGYPKWSKLKNKITWFNKEAWDIFQFQFPNKYNWENVLNLKCVTHVKLWKIWKFRMKNIIYILWKRNMTSQIHIFLTVQVYTNNLLIKPPQV